MKFLNEIGVDLDVLMDFYIHNPEPPIAPNDRHSPGAALGVPGCVDVQHECAMNNFLIDFEILPLLKPDEMKRPSRDFEANNGGNRGIDVVEDIRKNLVESLVTIS